MAAGELTHGFSHAERHQIDQAIRAAEQACRYEFSVFVGRSQGPAREFALRLHSASVAPDRSVLVLVDPAARAIEVVTGDVVRRTLTDGEVDLAIVAMRSAFAEGEIVSGLTRGITQLAAHARD